MVDGIFEHAGNGAIVFGRKEQNSLCVLDFAFQTFDGSGLILIVILVVERQVADLYLLERELWRRQFRDGASELPVEGIAAQAIALLTRV